MTTVIFRLAVDTITGRTPMRRTTTAIPTRLRVDADDAIILPADIRVIIPSGADHINVPLPPIGHGWAWKITLPGQQPLTVVVPDSPDPIELTDLMRPLFDAANL